MIEVVEMTHSTYAAPPHRFEAGTPPIAQAAGLGAAVEYLRSIGMDAISTHEHELTAYMLQKLTSIDGLLLLGLQRPSSGVRPAPSTSKASIRMM